MAESPFCICLVCLASKNCRLLNEWKEDVDPRTPTAFKMLLRYLKVEMGVGDDIGIVSLCEDCSQVANDFLELYQDFESIRLQLDVCVGHLYEFMEAGGQDPGRVREFEKLASYGKREDENCVRIVKSLRQDLIDKVCRKVRGSFPRISMGPKLKLKESDGKPFETPEKDEGACFSIGGAKSNGAGKPSGSSVVVEQDLSSGESRKDSSLASDAFYSELETSQPWKCSYCDKRCSTKGNLVIHQLLMHAKSFLSDEGRLPPHISEEELNASMAAVFEKLDPHRLQCPFCESKAVQCKTNLRTHLLRRHLEMVLENRDVRSSLNVGQGKRWKLGENDESASFSAPGRIPHFNLGSRTKVLPSSLKRKTKMRFTSNPRVPVKQLCGPHLQKDTEIWKCAPCGKKFSQKSNFRAHTMKMHPKTVLKKKLPPSISEENLITAADTIAKRVCKEMGDGQSRRKYRCVLCNNGKIRMDHYYLRVHVLRRHLYKVIKEVEVGEKVKQS